jgi:hypothetical protein
MRTNLFIGILCISAAVFALPASAQNGRQSTPATNGMCDELADKTPGLQGLCIALCEAQACDVEYIVNGDNTKTFSFGDNCGPSAPQLLDNYWNIRASRGNDSDPENPACVQEACPCWTESKLSAIGGGENVCSDSYGTLTVNSTNGIWETASVSGYWGECKYETPGEYTYRRELSSGAIQKCADTVRKCVSNFSLRRVI